MCIAQRIKNSCDYDIQKIYELCIKNKILIKKHIIKENCRTRYDAFIFQDNSRLTFKLCDENFDIIVWSYYNTTAWRTRKNV